MTTAFVFGFIVGGFVFWNVSAAVERFRRARWDFNATRRGLRTLIEMMWARGVQAVKGCLLAAGVIVAVVLVWRGHHFR
jgi:predicted membrane protein